MARAVPRQTCTYHCSECNGHFHALTAFSKHLRRVNQRKNRWEAPEYDLEHVVGAEMGLEVWTETGHCMLGRLAPQHPVVIWVVADVGKRTALLKARLDAATARKPAPPSK